MKLQTEAAKSLARWHDMVARRDLSDIHELLHPQVVFRSPMAHQPYPTAPVVATILQTVLTIFEDFMYHRELATDDGNSVVLEFSARVATRELKGIDFMRFDDAGKITEFEVMIRPLSGLQALGEQMGARLAPYLAAMKRQAP
jgi:hypothetical protein